MLTAVHADAKDEDKPRTSQHTACACTGFSSARATYKSAQWTTLQSLLASRVILTTAP